MSIQNIIEFCLIASASILTPGPAVLLATTHSLQHGPLKTLITIAGNISGLFCIATLSMVGVSALLTLSSTAFLILEIIGAGYLVFLGIKLWRNGIKPTNATIVRSEFRAKSMYMQGFLIAMTNPKAILFMTALFPQFIDSNASILPQFITLILVFMSLSFTTLTTYSVIAYKAKSKASHLFSGKNAGKLFGSAFIGFGALLATSSQK